MRLGIDITSACGDRPTGIGRYIRRTCVELLRLAPEDIFSFFCRLSKWRGRRTGWIPPLPTVRMRPLQEPFCPLFKGVDLIHGMDNRVPTWSGVARIGTVHDLAVLVLEEKDIASDSFRLRKREACRALIRRAHHIVAISQSTKDDLVRLFQVPEARVSVTHMGVDERFHPYPADSVRAARERHGLPSCYLLFVGHISTRKNVARIIEAYARSTARRDMPMVLAGPMSHGGESALETVRRLTIERDLRFLHYVPDEDLPPLYAGASAFVFPTLYEGFGMPILEAMACGVPVVTANTGAAPEVAGIHAQIVDPHCVEAISAGIDRALTMSPKDRDAAAAHARRFTWEACARKTLDVYRRVAAENALPIA